jgi:hypothetical protein
MLYIQFYQTSVRAVVFFQNSLHLSNSLHAPTTTDCIVYGYEINISGWPQIAGEMQISNAFEFLKHYLHRFLTYSLLRQEEKPFLNT